MPSAQNGKQKLVFFSLGVVTTIVALTLGSFAYIRFSHLPVATADPSFPMEVQTVHVPLKARIEREMELPSFAADAQVYQAGAKIYV